MTDVNARAPAAPLAAALATGDRAAPPDEARLVAMVELLFFAYRDFVAGPDAVLAELDFGRAHHRVLHFVNRNPGLRVADLLSILKITKQSLARVLKLLVDQGYILQVAGAVDRRERRLHTTDKGRRLADRLLALQIRHLDEAISAAGPQARHSAAAFLAGVIAPEDRPRAVALLERVTGASTGTARGQRLEST